MGLRNWLLRPYLERLQALEAELKSLREDNLKVRDELREVLKILNEKAEKDDLKDLRLRLNSIEYTLDSFIRQVEALEISLKGDRLLADDKTKEELILHLIREGYNTPKELKAMVPFGNKKLYEILKELEQKGLVRKIKKKRKVYYVAEEEAY